MNILENIVTELTPEEFEVYCLELIKSTNVELKDCEIRHNQIIKTHDGTYQLDGLIEFSHLGINYKTVVECKRYKSKIKRSQIQILHDTIQRIGANKGILISTSSFQQGAMEYARIHGITLLQIVGGSIMTIKNSLSPRILKNISYPKYAFAIYDLELKCPIEFTYKDKIEPFVNLLLE